MRLDAIGIPSKDFKKTIEFYTLLGFSFPPSEGEQHLEAVTKDGEVRLMIDDIQILVDILGQEPVPATYSAFALRYDSPEEVNAVAKAAFSAGFTVVKEPWDAFWGQRYAVLKDPDGTLVDLFAAL